MALSDVDLTLDLGLLNLVSVRFQVHSVSRVFLQVPFVLRQCLLELFFI